MSNHLGPQRGIRDTISLVGNIRENINALITVVFAVVLVFAFIVRGVTPTLRELAYWLTWHPLPALVELIETAPPLAGTHGTTPATTPGAGENVRVRAPEPATAARMELSRLDMDIAIVEADLQYVSDEARADKLAQRDDLRAARARVAAQVRALRHP